jgi:hypothetical protein
MPGREGKRLPLGLQYAFSALGTGGPEAFVASMMLHPAGMGGVPVELFITGRHLQHPDAEERISVCLRFEGGKLLTPDGMTTASDYAALMDFRGGKTAERPINGITPDTSPLGDSIRRAVRMAGWELGVPYASARTSAAGNWQKAAAEYWDNGGGLSLVALVENFTAIMNGGIFPEDDEMEQGIEVNHENNGLLP